MPDGDVKPAAARDPKTAFGRGFLYELWYFVELGAALKPGKLQRYEVLGQPILLGRDGKGQVYALRDICPHRAAPLSAGRVVTDAKGDQAVECPYHGWTFRTGDGACSAIPSLAAGQEMEVERIRVRSYPVRETQGLVFVYMTADGKKPAEPDHAPPAFPGAVGGAPKIVERMDFDSHLDHTIVGLMDPAHGPYVHQQWWWRSSKKQLDKSKAFEPREWGFAMARHAPSKNSRAYRILGGAPSTEITFRLPGLRWEHVQVGARQVLALTCLTPVNDNKTRITQVIWSDHWAFALLKPFIRAGARRFLHQDGDMVNLQNQGLRYDPPLLWIDDADKQAKWYQALKREWEASRREGRPFANPITPTTLRWRS
jgi:phenylpropionate dioxygenase-like ring-hydroxylating dioxygenase large terminal subunit